jgi:hypothetical protein
MSVMKRLTFAPADRDRCLRRLRSRFPQARAEIVLADVDGSRRARSRSALIRSAAVAILASPSLEWMGPYFAYAPMCHRRPPERCSLGLRPHDAPRGESRGSTGQRVPRPCISIEFRDRMRRIARNGTRKPRGKLIPTRVFFSQESLECCIDRTYLDLGELVPCS